MYFNDGSDPWKVEENHIRVFDFDDLNGQSNLLPSMTATTMASIVAAIGFLLLQRP